MEKTEREKKEEQLGQAKELQAQYHANVLALEQARKQLQSTQTALESRVQSLTDALKEAEAKAQAESSERARLAATLDAVEHNHADHTSRVEKLEVRVDTRLGHSMETTTYARERIGDAEFVVPRTTDLVMLPDDGPPCGSMRTRSPVSRSAMW